MDLQIRFSFLRKQHCKTGIPDTVLVLTFVRAKTQEAFTNCAFIHLIDNLLSILSVPSMVVATEIRGHHPQRSHSLVGEQVRKSF